MGHISRIGLGAGLVFVLAGCYDDASTTSETTTSSSEAITATFPSIQTHVLEKSCALSGCHVTGGQAPSMEAGVAYSNLVDQLSTGAVGMKYITPFKPSESYLIHKLEGTQSDAGGGGAQMPRGGTPLSADTIAKIKEWITNGAENN